MTIYVVTTNDPSELFYASKDEDSAQAYADKRLENAFNKKLQEEGYERDEVTAKRREEILFEIGYAGDVFEVRIIEDFEKYDDGDIINLSDSNNGEDFELEYDQIVDLLKNEDSEKKFLHDEC